MERFRRLFGMAAAEVRPTCVLTPYLTKDLLERWQIKTWHKGLRYACGNSEHFTLIHTRIGAGFVGDAVLLLAATPCRRMIFFGSAGAVRETPGLKLGALTIPRESFSMESFSALLSSREPEPRASRPDPELLKAFSQNAAVPLVVAASFGSLFLEDRYRDFFVQHNIEIVDMECSAFFTAAQSIAKPAVALLYVTDILGSSHLEQPATPQQSRDIVNAVRSGQKLISVFTGTCCS